MAYRPFNIDIPLENSKIILGKGIFFKYKSLEPNDIDYSLEIIKHRRIFCPKPSQTNDKDKEFKPPITVGDYSDPDYKQSIRSWAFRVLKKSPPYPTDLQIENEIKTFTQESLERYATQLESSYHQRLDDEYRLISLSDNPLNNHLWNDYSGHYSGICFGIQIHSSIGTAHKVNYAEKYPPWDLTADEGLQTLQVSALTKLMKWKREREYRVVLREPPLPCGISLIDQKLIVPPLFFRSIYLGHRINDKNKRSILQLIKHYLPHVFVFQLNSNIPFSKPSISRIS